MLVMDVVFGDSDEFRTIIIEFEMIPIDGC